MDQCAYLRGELDFLVACISALFCMSRLPVAARKIDCLGDALPFSHLFEVSVFEGDPEFEGHLAEEEVHQRVRRDAHLLAVLAHLPFEIGCHLHDDSRDDARARRSFLVDAVVLRDAVGHADAGKDGVARHLEGNSMLQDPESDHPPDRPRETHALRLEDAHGALLDPGVHFEADVCGLGCHRLHPFSIWACCPCFIYVVERKQPISKMAAAKAYGGLRPLLGLWLKR